MYKVGLTSKSNVLSDELFSSYAKADVRVMEISNCSDGYDNIDLCDAKRLSDKWGVTLRSLHLPFKTHGDIPHDIANPELSELAVEDDKRLIKRATDVGIKIFVVHPSGPKVPDEERSKWMEVCKKSLCELADYANEFGAVIAVENMTHKCLGNTIAEFEELVNAHPGLRVCFDINHLLYENPADLIKTFSKKIISLHVSDCNLEVEQHKMPGEGKIDFQNILRALGEVGYTGPWMYEVSYRCPQPEDDKYGLTCESFVRNAEELFAGKTPTQQRKFKTT